MSSSSSSSSSLQLEFIKDDINPPFLRYDGQDSFFGGVPPLSENVGYAVVLGFGVIFSIVTTILVSLNNYYGTYSVVTSEYFNSAGRTTKTGLISCVVVAQWTWAATLLQSSNVAWQYGVSGPFWYASGASIQIILFGVLAVSVKKNAPTAHTVCQIVLARWGRIAHLTYLFFCLSASIIVTSMLLLGGAATVEALTGVDYRLASFLIPWGVVLYTASGGLYATFLASYVHAVIIFFILITMIFTVYIKIYSSDTIYDYLTLVSNYNITQCQIIFSRNNNIGSTFYEQNEYSCGPIESNENGSYLTMISSDGLMFGIINIVGNFGTVFVDQSYWQSAMAAKPFSAARGFILAGLCWFAIPFSLASSLGLASVALQLPVNSAEAGAGLVPPAVATELLGPTGAILILIMLFMAIASTGAAEAMAVSSLFSYDIYREYLNPTADGEQILFISRLVVVLFGVFMGCFSIILYEMGLNLGWVYLFMGIMIGPAVAPLWNLMTWNKASGTGAIIAAWIGLLLGMTSWTVTAKIITGTVSIDTLGGNVPMLTGNLVSILSSATIHFIYSYFIDPQDYDFNKMSDKLSLIEDDRRGLTEVEKNPDILNHSETYVKRRVYFLTILLVIIWPLLAIPAGVFTKSYFAFWVMIAIGWGFGAAVIIIFLPIFESKEYIEHILYGLLYTILFRKRKGTLENDDDSDDDDNNNDDQEGIRLTSMRNNIL